MDFVRENRGEKISCANLVDAKYDEGEKLVEDKVAHQPKKLSKNKNYMRIRHECI